MSRVRLFGKLPSHGDFVARGMGSAERDGLDDWLSKSMADARSRLGMRFDDRYDRAPPWRFAGPEGAGVLVPSVDLAGRRYPFYLLLAQAAEDATMLCEELIYTAFSERWDADRLAAEAEKVAPISETVSEARWWTMGGEGFAPAASAGACPAGLLTTLLLSEEDA